MIRAHVGVVTSIQKDAAVFLHEWRFLSEASAHRDAPRAVTPTRALFRNVIVDGTASGDFRHVDRATDRGRDPLGAQRHRHLVSARRRPSPKSRSPISTPTCSSTRSPTDPRRLTNDRPDLARSDPCARRAPDAALRRPES